MYTRTRTYLSLVSIFYVNLLLIALLYTWYLSTGMKQPLFSRFHIFRAHTRFGVIMPIESIITW